MNIACIKTIRWVLIFSVTILLLVLPGCSERELSDVTLKSLKCEYLTDPLGIDVTEPRLSWILNSTEKGQRQTAYQVIVASSMENLKVREVDLWDTGKVNSDQSIHVFYDGRKLSSRLECWWQVRIWDKDDKPSAWSEPAMWSMGLLQTSDWQAEWIGANWEGDPAPSLPWLRKKFVIKGKSKHAMAYVSALGYYELYINGSKVDDHVLSPAVSDYSKRALYITHDVTKYLTEGMNCVTLWLGRGWYVKGNPGVIHNGPLVKAVIHVMSSDGQTLSIGTDTSWKVHPSPITPLGKALPFGDYGGEHYDARLELSGWNAAELDDSRWEAAKVYDTPTVVLAAQMVQPNRIIHTIKPVGVEELDSGEYLIDMGKNFTGWFELRFRGNGIAGSKVKLEYADYRQSNSQLITYNQRDEYIMHGNSDEMFRNRFNYHAFRWVKITGLDQKPSLKDIKGYLIHTDYKSPSEFECSNELLNNIYDTVLWTYRCLTLGGYIVDCPHRERLGYGGDAGTSFETGMFNFDMAALYTKWLANWRDAQDPKTGDLPYTAPAYPNVGGGGPAWSGICVTLPWQLYLQYGDKRILEVSYPTIQKWIKFLESKTVDHILEPYVTYGISSRRWNFLGDWLPPDRGENLSRVGGRPDEHSTKFFNNCYYLYNLQLAAKIASQIGRDDDATMFENMSKILKSAIHQSFFNIRQNTYVNGEQPYLAFPLLVDVMPEELRAKVMDNLEHAILVNRKGHLNSGMHGTYFMLKLLMQESRNDLIFEIANKKTYPGWGYMLEQGATTIWESWTGGSHIHDTLISIGSWFIQGIGGIRIDESSPGFKHFFIKPQAVGDLTWAKTTYNSIYGKIVSDWYFKNNLMKLNVTIPANTTATVSVPAESEDSVTESGRPASTSTGVTFLRMEDGSAVFSVNSGSYSFVVK